MLPGKHTSVTHVTEHIVTHVTEHIVTHVTRFDTVFLYQKY